MSYEARITQDEESRTARSRDLASASFVVKK
jgi:hypothetical protein